MDIQNALIHYGEVVAAIVGIISALVAFWKWVLLPVIKHFKDVKGYFAKIDTIFKELQPNSGSSLRDAINQMRNTLHTIEKRQRAWLSYEDQGIFETDADGRTIWTNRAYLKMLNVTFEETQGNGWKNFIHPANRERVIGEWNAAVADKRDCKMPIKYLSADNEEICATCEAFAIKDDEGKLTGYVGVVTIHDTLDKCK